MKKEVINTFGEGLIMDLHPLTTPSNVLTNCLNGTLLTYNGNEFVLQNDMGNGQVHTANLSKGYIPVGMKEHGGIIYVAAYNPLTNKSQIGSFPSPQQLFTGEETDAIAEINFSFNSFLKSQGNLLKISTEYYKEKLFSDKSTGIARKFHPGDRFIITIDEIPEDIKQAANIGVINFKLGVLNSKGNIDYIDESKIKIYNEPTGYWAFCYKNNKSTAELLTDNSLVQVFSANSSGELLLIIEYKTISAFNLIRQYTFNDGTTSVKLFGDIKSDIESLNGTTLENDNLGLVMDNSIKSEIILEGTSSTKITKEISPASIYGVLDRLKKSITIDFSTIKPNTENSSEWRYYITDTYIKIGWNYDYYNVDVNQQVDKIVFTFIDFTQSNQELSNLSGYSVDIIKEYYNGSFEEIFSFSNNLKKNWIYIVRIDRYINGEKSKTPYYRLLYTGTLFNQYYSSVLNYNDLESSVQNLPYSLNVTTKVGADTDFTYSVSTPNTSGFVNKVPTVDMFRKNVPSKDTNVSTYRYTVKKNKTYKVESEINADFNYNNLYAGYPNNDSLIEYIQNNISGTFGNPDESDLQYSNPDSALNASIDVTTSASGLSLSKGVGGNIGTLSGTISTNRSMIDKAGEIRDDSYTRKCLMPYYYTDMSIADRNKVIGFTTDGSAVRCITGKEDAVEFNGKLYSDGGVSAGTNAGGGDDTSMLNAVINMGNATVNIWAGRDGDNASIGWKDTDRIDNIDGWKRGEKSYEIDKHDDWLIAVWKNAEGGANPINLASQRTAPTSVSSTRTLIRTDVMLKCYLSQFLIVTTATNNSFMVGADANSYTFHTSYNTKVPLSVNLNTSTQNVDFYLLGDSVSINDRMNQWTSKIPELKNYLPTFQISSNYTYNEELSIGKDIDFASDSIVLNCYTNAYSTSVSQITTEFDENKIYLGIPSGTANSDGTMPLQKDDNGDYKFRASDNVISDWRNRESTLNYNINERFVIKQDGDYKEILARSIGVNYGKWYKGKDSNAPDMLKGIHFGRTKIYNEP